MSRLLCAPAHEQLVGFSEAYKGAGRGILSGFVQQNPEGFVLIDEVEKAHRNTQNLFLQILDAVTSSTQRGKGDRFLQVHDHFTTNLGSELYDSPNRAGVLQESQDLQTVVLEALGRESRAGRSDESRGGLSPELISRLAKGAAVLFPRLDGLALERIAQHTLERASER